MNPIAWVKAHPLATGTIAVVGGVVFFMIVTGGGSASSANTNEPIIVSSTPSDTMVAANAQLRLAEIATTNNQITTSGNVQIANTQASTAQLVSNNETTVGLANLQAQLKATEINNQAQVSIASIGANAAMAQAQAEAAAAQAQAMYQYYETRDTVGAQLQLGLNNNVLAWHQSDNALTLGLDNNATTRYQSDVEYNTSVNNVAGALTIASINAGVANHASNNALALGLDTNQTTYQGLLNTNATGLAATNRLADSLDRQTQVNRDISAFENDTARQQIAATTRQTEITANNERRSNRDSVIGNVIGSIGNVIGSIFSDERLKEEIILQGQLPNGLNLYSYKFLPTGEYQLGVMAQEVMLHSPSKVVRHAHTGAYMVDHSVMHGVG